MARCGSPAARSASEAHRRLHAKVRLIVPFEAAAHRTKPESSGLLGAPAFEISSQLGIDDGHRSIHFGEVVAPFTARGVTRGRAVRPAGR